MATIPNALLIGISSPYARRGLLWRKFTKHWGADGDSTLVVKAPTWTLNPSLPRDSDAIAEAYRRDAAWAGAEFGAEFRSDIESYITLEAIAACTAEGAYERAPEPNTAYLAFVDPSGGSSDFTLAIGH
jgi:hypothetical protein